MQIIIEIPEELYTKLFDNGTEDYGIVNDDLFVIAKSIRNCTPLDKHDEEVIAETVESIWGKPPYMDMLDKIRAEIEQNAYPIVHGVNNHEKGMTLYGILQVIDKYRGGIE